MEMNFLISKNNWNVCITELKLLFCKVPRDDL